MRNALSVTLLLILAAMMGCSRSTPIEQSNSNTPSAETTQPAPPAANATIAEKAQQLAGLMNTSLPQNRNLFKQGELPGGGYGISFLSRGNSYTVYLSKDKKVLTCYAKYSTGTYKSCYGSAETGIVQYGIERGKSAEKYDPGSGMVQTKDVWQKEFGENMNLALTALTTR